MNVSALLPAVEGVVDRSETCGENVRSGEQDLGIEEGVFEGCVSLQELLAQECGILDVGEEDDSQGVVQEMGQCDGLHFEWRGWCWVGRQSLGDV